MSADLDELIRSDTLITLRSDHVVTDGGRSEEEVEGLCRTPINVIPPAVVCPPAPRKPSQRRVTPACKRKLFEIVAGKEIEAFFRRAEDEIATAKKRRCIM